MDGDRRENGFRLKGRGRSVRILQPPTDEQWEKFRQHEKDVAVQKPQEKKEGDEKRK